MRCNEDHAVFCWKCVLIPYKQKHVPRYHNWMQDENLQQLTASEPLSLDEEYAMQESWHKDSDKLTFILLDRGKLISSDMSSDKELEAMIGDVNLFLNDSDDRTTCELEIMLAESSARGKGIGREAILAMAQYSIQLLQIQTFTVKVGLDNSISIAMFQKLGFKEVSRSEVFQEISFVCSARELSSHFTEKLDIRPYKSLLDNLTC